MTEPEQPEAAAEYVVEWVPEFMRKAIRAGANPGDTVQVTKPEPVAFPDGMTVERETIEWPTGALHEFIVRHTDGHLISHWFQQEAKRAPGNNVDV